MQSLKEYFKLYPADTGVLSKQSKRLEHIIDELKQHSSLNIESKEVYDEFMSNVKHLNELSKKIQVGKEKWYAKKS